MFRRVGIRLALILGDLALIALALLVASWLRPRLGVGRPLPLESAWVVWPVYALALTVWGTGFLLIDVYNLQKNLRLFEELQRLVAAHAATSLAFSGTLYFSFRDTSRLQTLSFAIISLLFLIGYRLIFRLLLQLFGHKRYGSRRVLIVGAGLAGADIAQMVINYRWTGLQLVGFVDDDPEARIGDCPRLGSLQETIQIVQERNVNEVIFTLPREAHDKLANLVVTLEIFKVNVRVVPDFFDLVFLRSVIEDFGGMALVTLREPALDPLQRLIKRGFDILVSSISLFFASPIMVCIAVSIKLDSVGPIIFTQQRVGENGRIFKMYKFRTMVHDAEAKQEVVNQATSDGHILHKFYDDPRVTRFGRFLRRTSLDELPQLINIFKGEMSLVGPRPELPWLVDRYEPWQRKRFEVPQGLTGWWQINGRSDKPMHLHTEEDLYYIKNYSLWFDIHILWRTIKAVLDRRGAY